MDREEKLLEVHFYGKKGQKFKKYSPEFKLSVIIDMLENHLNYHETARKYNLGDPKRSGARLNIKRWERIYLEKGAEGLMAECRGRKTSDKHKPQEKLAPENEKQQDETDELEQLRKRNRYLEMENEYLKKLRALVLAEERKSGKKR